MTVAVHIVTASLPPLPGGLERWTHDLAEHLTASGFRVVVYVCHARGGRSHPGGYRIVDIAEARQAWEAPLVTSVLTTKERIGKERARLNVALLRAEIGREMAAYPQLRHCVLSTFATGVGQDAMLVTRDLNLPHVAMVVGSDFSRGFRNPVDRVALRELCATANCIVCRSSEQALSLKRDMPPRRALVVPTPVTYPCRESAAPGRSGVVRLFADCGASYQKGTIVVLRAFRELLEAGHRVSLELCGPISDDEEAFWRVTLAKLASKARRAFRYLGQVTRERVHEGLRRSSIYCSASLGEGSSAARLSALCSGIPMVTSRCGEFAADVKPMSHVRVVDVGDAAGFKRELSGLVSAVEAGAITVDWDRVAAARERFAPVDKWSVWIDLLSATASAPRNRKATGVVTS